MNPASFIHPVLKRGPVGDQLIVHEDIDMLAERSPFIHQIIGQAAMHRIQRPDDLRYRGAGYFQFLKAWKKSLKISCELYVWHRCNRIT